MLFLVAYDITDPSRLGKTARVLERHAQRCQKSVFLFEGSRPALHRLIEDIRPLVDLRVDLVQAWQLGREETVQGLFLGNPAVLMPASLVLGNPVTTPNTTRQS